ncbi:sensor histidine kinase [Rheinheimera aquimaris]|jgi:two-component system sensor histidine kinase CpxA|uniref:sensor histidine kinase n=1 Tax=Rheinheimera aquimaris TaxID=412437 RepID=UPI0039E219E0
MTWLSRLNPFHYLAGRIFLWFWLVLLIAVFGTLALSRALVEQTEIRRLPHSIIQQLQQQVDQFANSTDSQQLLARLQQDKPGRWLLVNADTNTVLTPELLPRDFDQHWLTELSQLSRARWLKHHNMSLAGPFVLRLGNETLALYQKRQRPPQPWWRLSEMPQHVLLGLTLLVSAVASFILAVSISRPLRELLQRNLQFADGKLQSRVTNLSKRQDERISALLTNQQRLLRDISHELRSPLARAQLALGLAERQQNLEQVPRLKQELDRLDAMLDELLTFSKLDAGQYQMHKQPFDLPELLTEIIEVNQVEADARQQTINLHTSSGIQIYADSRLLARAVENVLRNAIKYSPAASMINISLLQQANQLVLTIRDQGPGIAPEQLDAVFEPFYRVSNSRNSNTGGTGLGLAIVAQIVRQHGGQVRAENSPQGGLCITMHLPVK